MATYLRRATATGEPRVLVRIHKGPSRTFTNMKDARIWGLEMDRKRLSGDLDVPTKPLPFGEFLDGYLKRKESEWRESTISDRKQVALSLEVFRDVRVNQISRGQVEDLIASKAVKAPRTAQKALALLKAVLRSAQVRKQKVDEGIFNIPAPKYESRTVRILTLEEVDKLASWMPDFIHRIIPVAALTGLRQGELFDLQDDDLHLDSGWLQVRHGKTAAARRRVNLGDEAVKLLKEQLIRRPHAEYVFPAFEGGRLHKNNFGFRYFRPARESAGIPEVNFHDMRATYASLMIRASVDIRTIAAQMGHKDGGSLLLRRYGWLYSDSGERGAAALDALVKRETA